MSCKYQFYTDSTDVSLSELREQKGLGYVFITWRAHSPLARGLTLLPVLTVKAGRGPVYSAQATDLLREELWAGPGAWVSLSPPSAAF